MSLNVVEILQSCPLFADVGPTGFQRLAVLARLQQYDKGQTIFREGDACPGVFIVGSGMVRVFKTGPGGREHVLHIVGPGNTFAELAAVGGFDLPANAEALAPSVCALLPQEPFRRALDEDHDLCREMLTGLTVWFRHFVGLIEDIVLRDAAGRLARYLLKSDPPDHGSFELPSLKRHVASHLNLTSEAFSRTLRRLVDAGLICEENGSRIRLVDREGLALVAEGMFPRV
jgi:CRP/FNR family transcriptional regulator